VKKFQALTEVVRPEGPTAGDGVLGEGAASPPPHQLEGLGDCCKLPQPDLGQNPSQNRIWCIMALKTDIWWQQLELLS